MQTETIWVLLGAALLIIELWAINRVRKSEGKSSTKGVWMVLIVFVPLIGLIAWALAGPKHISHRQNAPEARQ
ncbi:MAG: PLD nuclease N-terminal domain-containing protein [Pseudomonas sp.]|uniref:PLD nuclease N-terminal domain-containing protein n=1 Tax=Pseudomonas abieticivorans TaxID=2931382 RepID=UPI0020C0E50B|nr:PLD nuclease N-terminal domain-containing protein [Pseudomonas sp. PIA16]MDE1169467.1 PLD nuclease N-terminal domain-containing protein [Pseudomonas sp.]